mgnify:CR=1 FL=1
MSVANGTEQRWGRARGRQAWRAMRALPLLAAGLSAGSASATGKKTLLDLEVPWGSLDPEGLADLCRLRQELVVVDAAAKPAAVKLVPLPRRYPDRR